MIILFIVIANEVLKCYISSVIGIRFCEAGSPVELTRMWEIGLVEVAFEGAIGGVAIKIWRRLKDRFPDTRGRQDRLFNIEDDNK